MFNVLAWNIQFFTLRRLDDNSGSTFAEVAANSERTLANVMYIVTTVEQSTADIFVVIEPRSSQGNVERLATGGGPNGLLYLLAQLREWMPTRNWCLVPPLRLNPRDHVGRISTYTECIGVFWSDVNLAFTGPFVWPDGNANASGPPIAPGTGNTADYPAPWNGTVPANLRAAGRCRFYKPNGDEIMFPDEYNRRPFYTTFQERNAPNRNLKLFTMHTSPGTALDGLAKMLSVTEKNPGNNDVSLIIGDLNVDLSALSTTEWSTITGFRTLQGFGLVPPLTHISPTTVRARPEATPARYLTTEVLDYSFLSYGPNANPATGQAAVVNRVAGTPQVLFTSDMVVPLVTIRNIQNANDRNEQFRQRWNYGHIAQPRRNNEVPDLPGDGTSDHIPIYVSV